MSYADGYTINTHCDHPGHNPLIRRNGDFFGDTKREAFQSVYARGWNIDPKTRTAFCPDCVRRFGKTPLRDRKPEDKP